jgi:hypothetical protein
MRSVGCCFARRCRTSATTSAMPSPAPGSALSCSPPRSCRTCESTWNATPSPAAAACLHRPERRQDPPQQFQCHLVRRVHRRRSPGRAFSRPAPHGRHACRDHRRDSERTDDPAWPLKHPCRDDLPARHPAPATRRSRRSSARSRTRPGTAHDLARGWPTGRSPSSGNIRNNAPACESGRRESNPHDQLGRSVTRCFI